MKHSLRQKRTASILFFLTIAMFFAFFLYMDKAERVSVYHAEQTHSYCTVTDVQEELVSDDMAPVGVRKVYQWVLDPAHSQESCLCFNIAHHNIHVYFDGELVYSLTGADSNRIGRNVSSNWCSVHVGQEHAGKTVTVVLTPLLEAAMSKQPEFLLGSHYAIAMDLISRELAQILLSSLCVLLGVFVAAVALYFRYFVKTEADGLIYLGFFSMALGLWKLTDLRSTPLLFPDHSMAFGYISVGSLFLAGLSLLLYFSTLFVEEKRGTMHLLSCVGSLMCMGILAAQVLGMGEIRQNLIFSHILLILAGISVPGAALLNRLRLKSWGLQHSWKLLFLLLIGISLDLFLYYRNNGNGVLSFTVLGFVIYTLIVFLGSIQDATRKAYTDIRTGLVNRARWNELMHRDIPLPEPYGILVIDLNGLKRVNDTLGHEAGDQMIFQLSGILRNTLPRASVICRWGGDEFAVLLSGVNRAQLDQQVEQLLSAREKYNADHPELPIHFAVGAALSSEHPGLSRTELFHLADEQMYGDKQAWYAGQNQ